MTNRKKIIIKAILFDLGGVIMHGGYLPFIQKFCKACLTPEGKRKITSLERQVNLGSISEPQFYRKIKEVFGVHLTPKQMHDEIVDGMTVDKELVKFIPRLKKAKVALFSNSIGHMAEDVLKKRRIPSKKLFDKVFISSKLHMVKPDKKAYHEIAKKLGIRPEQTLLIDDREDNVRGAIKAGMQGIVYKNLRQFKRVLQKYELV